jgi:hypothetical protein
VTVSFYKAILVGLVAAGKTFWLGLPALLSTFQAVVSMGLLVSVAL